MGKVAGCAALDTFVGGSIHTDECYIAEPKVPGEAECPPCAVTCVDAAGPLANGGNPL